VWGRCPKVRPEDKTLQCKIVVARGYGRRGWSYICGRKAKRYACEKNGYNLGLIDCCVNHKALHEKQGIVMRWIDRRKKVKA
jgi:hypothetical protein